MNIGKVAYLAFVLFFLLVFTLTLTAPALKHIGYDNSAEANYLVFSSLCHQLSERSFSLFGFKLAVCARCFGIYIGLLSGALMYPLLNRGEKVPPPWLILVSIAPLALDGITQILGFRESNNLLRLVTGFLFGVLAPFYLIPAFKALASDIHRFYIHQRR
jgi:uncharacterized membrane protein